MADTDTPPRFFKVFISHYSSDSMLIPVSYYDELPHLLPEMAILQGTGGCTWNVAMKKKRDEVYFEQGWAKFVEDNSLSDGDFLTFVYDGDSTFEVSIYGPDGCKEVRAVTEAEDGEEDSDCSLSSEDTEASSESEMVTAIPRSKNKGKSIVEAVEESDDEGDSVYTDTESDTISEFKMAKTVPRSGSKGKKKERVVESDDEDSDSDYTDAFGRLDVGEDFNSEDSSYAPNNEDTAICAQPKGQNLKKKPKTSRERVKPKKITNPEKYLDNPKNVYFVTSLKNRKFELLVHAQLVKDYCLKFPENIHYVDNHGKLPAKTALWNDQRVCIKKWNHILKRNKVKKGDPILCELFRKRGLVRAIKVHFIKEKDL